MADAYLQSPCLKGMIDFYMARLQPNMWAYIHSTIASLGTPCPELSLGPGWYEDKMRLAFNDNGTVNCSEGALGGTEYCQITAPTVAWIEVYLEPTRSGQVTITQGSSVSPAFDISLAQNYSIGTPISLRASAYQGYIFKRWEVYLDGAFYKAYTSNPQTLTVDRGYTVKAVFESETAPPSQPLPQPPMVEDKKEYVIEFSGTIKQDSLMIQAANKIVALLGGRSVYIEGGNKLVVVM